MVAERDIKINTAEPASSCNGDTVKADFCAWLLRNQSKSIDISSVVSVLDAASEQLQKRKITSLAIWEIAKSSAFSDVYSKARDNKFFRIMDKKKYFAFMRDGQLYLKFLKTKPVFKVEDMVEEPQFSDEQSTASLTIKEAVLKVLSEDPHSMTADEIYDRIIEQGLYVFGTQNPVNVVRTTIEYSCNNSGYSNKATAPCFCIEENGDGKRTYSLLESELSETPKTQDLTVEEIPSPSEHSLVIWDYRVEQEFQKWLERENYAQKTVDNYRRATAQAFRTYQALAQKAIVDSNTELEAVRKYIVFLNEDSDFTEANATRHNQFTAALASLERFYSTGIEIVDNEDEEQMNKQLNGRVKNNIAISEELLTVLSDNYANGFRFETTSVRLLSDRTGIEIDIALQKILKRSMFCRNDDVYFLIDTVADEEIMQDIVSLANCWLDNYGCFEISELYALFANKLNSDCIGGAEDFEALYQFINKRDVRCVAYYSTRIARIQKSIPDLSADIAKSIITTTREELGGVIDEDELKNRFSAFSAELLSKIIKQYIEELVITEINGTVCYQTLDTLGLSDDFSDTLSDVLSRIGELDLTPSQEVLNTALSLEMGVNFRNEYYIPDDRTFRRLITVYYKAEPRREWKGGAFEEVSN
ncbi:MAG: hypothetical protein AB9844_00810 [Clostridiaceae bacterium]